MWKFLEFLAPDKKSEDYVFVSMNDLVLALVQSSNSCYDSVKSFIVIPDKKERDLAHLLTYYEFVYFFMHVLNRAAHGKLTPIQHRKMQSYIGPIIASIAINTFSKHWPTTIKENMKNEFYENMNTAEMDYSTYKELFTESNYYFTGKSLMSRLARNVADAMGCSMQASVMTLVMSNTIDVYKKIDFKTLVHKVDIELCKN